MNIKEQAETSLARLCAFAEKNHFAGYDPYDAMNSPLLRLFSGGAKYGRIAVTQFMRRCPVNLRPLLMTPKGHNPKGLGLFLAGYARIFAMSGDETAKANIARLLELLEKYRSRGFSGNCWGYNFDWQSRAAFVPKHTPTIVNSAFIGHALLDAWELAGSKQALDMAIPIKDFLLDDLNREFVGDSFCFSYTPLDENYVHNANMLGASLLIRLAHLTGDDALADTALYSLAYSMDRQHEDGSWFYAETDFQRWIDSFHTGFNLEALRWFIRLGKAEKYRSAYQRGVKYYADNFFLSDGMPKYYHDRLYPVDIHSPAEAIAFFSGEDGAYRPLTEKILDWMLRNLWDDQRGIFYFRKTAKSINKIPYMRWSEAWGFRALTEYLYSVKRSGEQ